KKTLKKKQHIVCTISNSCWLQCILPCKYLYLIHKGNTKFKQVSNLTVSDLYSCFYMWHVFNSRCNKCHDCTTYIVVQKSTIKKHTHWDISVICLYPHFFYFVCFFCSGGFVFVCLWDAASEDK